jgi:hypothetical protein
MLNPRAIALQGVGFGRQYVALQGFVQVSAAAQREDAFFAGGGTISASEWRRRHELKPDIDLRAKRRRREELFLLNRLH